MKKRVISISIIVITILGLLMAILLNTVTYGYEENIDGLTWYYQKSNNKAFGVYLKSGTPGETLTIPSTLGGATVVGISGANTSTSYQNRFNILNQKNENTTIKKVVIPETVTNIDNNTFANFCGLTEINIPSGVTSIGAYAYYNCSGATNELIIPDSVVAIFQE